MNCQKYPNPAAQTLRRFFVILISALLLVACAAPVQKSSAPKQSSNLASPKAQRQQRLRNLVKTNVIQNISANALSGHDAVTFVRAALDALHRAYALDLAQLSKQLQKENAFMTFYKAMVIAYDKRQDVPAEEIDQTAIAAMLKLVDTSSKFYTAREFAALRKGMGKRGSVGLSIDRDKQGLLVFDVLEGSSAAQAKVPLNSHVLSVDKIDVQKRSVADVRLLLRGQPGSQVELTVKGPNGAAHDYQLQRSVLKIENVVVRKLKHDTLYIQINKFNRDTDKSLADEISKLHMHPRAVILDLRSSRGGAINSVVYVADLFLSGGKLISLKNRNELFNVDFRTKTGDALENTRPIVVLVSSATASGAEALALSLRTKAQARIIGSQTEGSASIRTLYRLHDGTAMKLTMGRMLLANGQTWQGKGIRPDICIDFNKNRVVRARHHECQRSYFNHATLLKHDVAVNRALSYIKSKR